MAGAKRVLHGLVICAAFKLASTRLGRGGGGALQQQEQQKNSKSLPGKSPVPAGRTSTTTSHSLIITTLQYWGPGGGFLPFFTLFLSFGPILQPTPNQCRCHMSRFLPSSSSSSSPSSVITQAPANGHTQEEHVTSTPPTTAAAAAAAAAACCRGPITYNS